MKKKYLSLPAALKKQVLIRGSFAGLSLIISVSMLLLGMEFLLIASLLAMAAFFAYDAGSVLFGEYVVIYGKCADNIRNTMRTRSKWIIIDTKEARIRVRTTGNRHKHIRENDAVAIYLSSKARVYQHDEYCTIYNYWTLEKEGV